MLWFVGFLLGTSFVTDVFSFDFVIELIRYESGFLSECSVRVGVWHLVCRTSVG